MEKMLSAKANKELLESKPKTIVKMKFGSHLYGTNTPSSDMDYKGVFAPSREMLLYQECPESMHLDSRKKPDGEKNNSSDVDLEIFSIKKFLDLALEGQTVAIDMLHADWGMIEDASIAWDILCSNRDRFYTKSLKAFVGYAKRQAAKYGIKGSRIDTCNVVISILESNKDATVNEIVDTLTLLQHVSLTNNETAPVEVLGKGLTGKAKCEHYIKPFKNYLESYGSRAREANLNQNVDWKALSHAIRAAEEVKRILTKGDLSLPFDTTFAGHLVDIKTAKLPFIKVQEELEFRIEELERLSEASSLPSTPDYNWASSFLKDINEEVVRNIQPKLFYLIDLKGVNS